MRNVAPRRGVFSLGRRLRVSCAKAMTAATSSAIPKAMYPGLMRSSSANALPASPSRGKIKSPTMASAPRAIAPRSRVRKRFFRSGTRSIDSDSTRELNGVDS
jgi:hypothetical protein